MSRHARRGDEDSGSGRRGIVITYSSTRARSAATSPSARCRRAAPSTARWAPRTTAPPARATRPAPAPLPTRSTSAWCDAQLTTPPASTRIPSPRTRAKATRNSRAWRSGARPKRRLSPAPTSHRGAQPQAQRAAHRGSSSQPARADDGPCSPVSRPVPRRGRRELRQGARPPAAADGTRCCASTHGRTMRAAEHTFGIDRPPATHKRLDEANDAPAVRRRPNRLGGGGVELLHRHAHR